MMLTEALEARALIVAGLAIVHQNAQTNNHLDDGHSCLDSWICSNSDVIKSE